MPGLPEYSWEEISKHKTPEDSVWIVFNKGVYDITSFLQAHPGGNKILLAAGGSANPFWNLYRVHQQEKVYQILESLRIGNLKKGEKSEDLKDPYAADPERSKNLIVLSEKPFNAETPHDILSNSFITPNSEFFIRNHLPVPVVDLESYSLELVYEDDKCTSFTLKDLKNKFEIVKVESVIQCAGNRRNEANKISETRGAEWRGGAIGNSVWTGVRLSDVLKYFGEVNSDYKFINIEALDSDPNGPFGTTIPMSKALDPDTILAFEMNGEPLPRDHGFPLRLIVPGYIGVRNVKCVKRITLSKNESELIWHKRDYRLFSTNDSLTNVNFEKRPPMYETPVQSIICSPLDGSSYKTDEKLTLKGFANSGGGRSIVRVEITTDKGENWTEAKILNSKNDFGKNWTWALWEAKIHPEDIKNEICVKAVDSASNTQPESAKTVWNYRGLLTNPWHCINLHPKP